MKSADDVKLSDRFGVSRCSSLKGFFERHRVGPRSIFFASKGAKPTGSNTNIRRIDVAIYVEVRLIAVHALAHEIGHPSNGQDVAGSIENQGIVGVQPPASHYLFINRHQPLVVCLKSVDWSVRSHLVDDIARESNLPIGDD